MSGQGAGSGLRAAVFAPRGRAVGAVALLLGLLAGCVAPPTPRLAQAFAAKGDAATRAKAFLKVAIEGAESERTRAAFLWGVFACEARSPRAGLEAFDLAEPSGSLARVAMHRLEDALAASQSAGRLWRLAVQAPWMAPEDRARLRVRAAEELAELGQPGALEALPALSGLPHDQLLRALVVIVRFGASGAADARRRLAVEFPQEAAAMLPPKEVEALARSFTAAEWATQAQAWLDAGQPEAALRSAARGGAPGFLIAARAALKLRRSTVAAAWASRGGDGCAACWAERADAYRQIAWGNAPGERPRRFADMLRAAERLHRLVPAGDPLAGRDAVLMAEALTELGRFAQALPFLTLEAAQTQPRWEWVCRRWFLLQAEAVKPAAALPEAAPGRTARVQRLAAYWRAHAAAAHGDRSRLEKLVRSGLPDLPALWAARELPLPEVPVTLSDLPAPRPAPPAWARDLMSAGRVTDVVFAWRAQLDAAGQNGPDWLGVAALASMPPLDAIPLLVRGEPRLFTGPWQDLSRDLLKQYLPLPWRAEVEAAAARGGIPPWLLAGVVRQESAWNPRARSAAGAVGLAQVLPDVGDEAGRSVAGLAPRGDLYDPARNLILGARLLARWRASFGGSWEAALACYNAGERRIREIWDRTGGRGGPAFVEGLEIPENWDYVHRVALLAEGYRILYWPDGRPFPWT